MDCIFRLLFASFDDDSFILFRILDHADGLDSTCDYPLRILILFFAKSMINCLTENFSLAWSLGR